MIQSIGPRATVTDVKPVIMYEITTDQGAQFPYRIGYVPKVGDVVCVNPVTRVIQHSLKECECPWNVEFKA